MTSSHLIFTVFFLLFQPLNQSETTWLECAAYYIKFEGLSTREAQVHDLAKKLRLLQNQVFFGL